MADIDTVKAALEAIADRAPHADHVRARFAVRLEAKQHVRRTRRALLAGAGALGTAAVVGVPLITTRHRAQPTVPPATTTPRPTATTSAPAGPGVTTQSFLYEPTWLPDEMAEVFRQVVDNAGTPYGSSRIWLPRGKFLTIPDPKPRIELDVNTMVQWGPFDQTVRIGSVTGKLMHTPDITVLQWTPPGGFLTVLLAEGIKDYKTTMVRIAESVRKTDHAMSFRMRVPWIPERFRGHAIASVRPTAGGGWTQRLGQSPAYNGGGVLVNAGSQPNQFPGGLLLQAKRADGTYAWVGWGGSDKEALTKAEATRMLDEFDYAAPDMTWATT